MDEPDVTRVGAPEPPADTKSQFRTYASDVAKLTGKPLPKDVKNIAAPRKQKAPEPAPKKEAPQAPAEPLPEPPPAKIIPKAPSTDEKKEAVLERLLARQQKAQQAPPPVAAGPIPEPPPAQIFPKAPSTDEKREDVLARLKAKVAAAPPAPMVSALPTPDLMAPPVAVPFPPQVREAAPQAPAAAQFGELSPIHTYKTDFSDHAKAERASRISILAAEQNARGTRAPQAVKGQKNTQALFIGGAVLLLLAGSASVFFAYRLATGRPMIPVELTVPSLIFADEQAELSGDGDELHAGLLALSDTSLPEGGVVVAYMTYATTTKEGVITIPATGGALIAALGLPAPEVLLRNVEPESTVGVIRSGGATHPFLILSVASFERTFAGMLEWEPTMVDDLASFYPPHPDLAPALPVLDMSATTTPGTYGTSSTPVAPVAAPVALGRPSFRDEVIDNHDVRVYRDAGGRVVMLYGYRDKETLIIARDEGAFREILSRLATSRSR